MIHNKYYEIMKNFLSDYSREIYGRELVGKVSISQKNIALTLEELEKKGILSSKVRGNMRYFFLNKSNPLCKRYLVLIEIENSIEFLEKNPKINHILDKINNSLINSQIGCIFGSYAKGNQKKDSDLDLFVVGKVNEKEIKKIGEDYNIEIDIKNGKKLDFINMLKNKNPLMNEILESHVLILGYEEFIEEVIKQKW